MARHDAVGLALGEDGKGLLHVVDAERAEVLDKDGIVVEVGFDDELGSALRIEQVEEIGFVDLKQLEMDLVLQ